MVSNLLTFITGRPKSGIIEYTHGLKQSSKQNDQTFISILDIPVTRWVKLSLNFELLVKRVMKFLLGQRLFNNNIFCTT